MDNISLFADLLGLYVSKVRTQIQHFFVNISFINELHCAKIDLQNQPTRGITKTLIGLAHSFKASTGAKLTNLVVVSLLSIIPLPSDIAISVGSIIIGS